MEKLEEMSKMLEILEKKQNEIDKKTKDAEAYKELNLKLIQHNNITHIIFGILILIYVICNSMIIYHLVDKYFELNVDAGIVDMPE